MADSYKVFDKAPIVEDAVSIHGYSFRKRELALGIVALLALIVCVILAALLATAKSGGSSQIQPSPTAEAQTSPQTKEFCTSPTCLRSSAYVQENMKSSVDPCNNFYQYACGTWSVNNPLKPDVSQLTPSWNIYYKNQDRLRKLIETPSSRSDENSAERKLKDFFASCTDHYGKMTYGGNPFLKQIVAKAGGWYVLGTWNESNYNLNDIVKKVHVDFWTNVFFTFSIRTDWLDWNKDTIQIDLSGTGMSWYYYVSPSGKKFVENYKKFIRRVGGYLLRDSGINITAADSKTRIDTFVSDVYAVEYGLAAAVNNSDPTQDPHNLKNRVQLKDLNPMTDKMIDWVDFFTYMFDESPINENSYAVLLERDYLAKMAAFVNGLGANKSRMLNNYITWRLAHKYVQDLSWDYIHANRDYYVDLTGRAEFLGTFRYCLGMVDRDMGEALSSLFVKDHFSKENKQKAEDIVTYLRDAFVEQIGEVTWMDEKTRNLAKSKIHNSLYKLGYPDFMMNEGRMDDIYKALKVDKSDYFANRMSMNSFYKADWNRRAKAGKNFDDWTYNTYQVVLEYYNPWKELIVPAGILQWPMYDHKLPHFMNFGTLGSMIGHNLVHAIDKTGAQYKMDGSQMGYWWTNQTRNHYLDVHKCVRDAYSNMTLGPYKLSTGQTRTIDFDGAGYVPEALAETSGIRLAYKAFKQWEKRHKVEQSLAGLSHTNNQLFFMAYAQGNCFTRTGNEAFFQANRGILQENFKVNMALSQVPEFREAFKCSATAKMVAPKLCTMY